LVSPQVVRVAQRWLLEFLELKERKRRRREQASLLQEGK
jgi:hypothetical protein